LSDERGGRSVEDVPYSFFWRRSEQSLAKARIACEIFVTSARFILRDRGCDKISFVDPYAGPGAYASGQLSTPLMLLQKAERDATLRNGVLFRFSDRERVFADALRANAADIMKKGVNCRIVAGEAMVALNDAHAEMGEETPVFVFADPWRYSGVGELVWSSSIWSGRPWSMLALFNYWRTELALKRGEDESELAEVFGHGRFVSLRDRLLRVRDASEREQLIIAALSETASRGGECPVEVFRFRTHVGDVAHHLVFTTSAGPAARRIARNVMARYSVPSGPKSIFEYNGRMADANVEPAVALRILETWNAIRGERSADVSTYRERVRVAEPRRCFEGLGGLLRLEELRQWISGTRAVYLYRGHFAEAGTRTLTAVLHGNELRALVLHDDP
jgi:three-Cys-motif partner protein